MANAGEKVIDFVTRVKNFIKTDDDTAIKATQKQALKIWKKNIVTFGKIIKRAQQDRDEEVEALEEYLIEAKEELTNAYINIDIDKAKKIDDRKSYVNNEYQDQIANAMSKVDGLKKSIEKAKETCENIEKEQKGNIDIYNIHIKAIS